MPTRRQFLRRASAGAAAVLAPQALFPDLAGAGGRRALRGGSFADGVISADPTTRAISLWTRVEGVEGPGHVILEVARDRAFRDVVAARPIPTSGAVYHTVKARVGGLRPHEDYFYRFHTATAESAVGRFRTALPADSRQPVRFAYFSCQDFTHGFYNAHRLLAQEDLDFVVCLGDYIYAETYHTTRGGTAVRNDPIGVPSRDESHVREAVTLAQYRRKWSLYRSDPALRAVHARFPMVYIPDDHEVVNNYAGGAPGGGLPPEKQYSPRRRAAARKAFFENNPRFAGGNRLYRSLRFGRTVELFVMDQRTYRDNQPCGDRVVPPCDEWNQPRTFLGRRQMDWLKDGLSRSTAAWKVLANEVTIMPTVALGGAFFQYDSWQGYPREREELLAHIRDRRIRDVVFVTGDIHTFIAGDVRTDMGLGESVALEFVGGSITSQAFGETDLPVGNGTVLEGNNANPNTPQAIIDVLRAINPWVDSADFDHHGYGVIEARETGLESRFVRLQTVKRRSLRTLPVEPYRYRVERGQTSIKGQRGPV